MYFDFLSANEVLDQNCPERVSPYSRQKGIAFLAADAKEVKVYSRQNCMERLVSYM